MQTWDTIVIGAGISGLSAAFTLSRQGFRVLVVEKRCHVGGRATSERMDGFLMEHGPTSLVAPCPGAERLIDAIDLTGDMVFKGRDVRRRYLVRDGRVHGLSLSPSRFFLSPFFSWRGRARLLLEPLVAAKADDETVADWVRRRFGREILDYVFDPLVGGLMAGSPETLSMQAVLPHLKRLERQHGSIIRAVARSRAASGSALPGGRTLFSFKNGVASLPQALAAYLNGNIQLETRAISVAPAGGGGYMVKLSHHGETRFLHAGSVIIALPAYGAAELLAPVDGGLADSLAAIPHPPLAVVFQGYRREDIRHPLDGLGFLTPSVETRSVLGTLFSSTLFAGRAPEGYAALTSFVGGARQPELAGLPVTDLNALAADEARHLLGTRGAPVLSRIRHWRKGLPQPGLAPWYSPVSLLYGALNRRSSPLPPALRSLVTVRVSQINHCAFCVDINSATLLKRGVAMEKINSLASWRDSPLFDADERLALEYAEAMTIPEPGVDDGLRQRLKARFSEDTLAELTGLIAFQNLSSKFNAALDVPPQGFCIAP